MTRTLFAAALAATAMTVAASADAAPLYVNDFDADTTASWTVNAGPTDHLVDFYYDYSLIGVPAAPGGASTRGLKMAANISSGIFGGFSVSPTGESFAGDYQVSFDIWQNYVGPLGPGGSGTTQLSTYGIGTAGNVAFWPGAAVKESVGFGTTLDGGSASDVRGYSSAAPFSYQSGDAVYQSPGGTINNSDAYYAGFASQSAPAAQLVLYPGQTGSTDTGETSFAWRRVVIDVSGGFANWSIDGLPLARVDLSTVALGGGNIFFGHSDTNSGSSTDPFNGLLNVTLIDNVQVSNADRVPPVPEPGTLVLSMLALGGAAMNRRRVRRR